MPFKLQVVATDPLDSRTDIAVYGVFEQGSSAALAHLHKTFGPGLKDFVGPQRFKLVEPQGLLLDAGARIAFGSDWPVDALDEWFALKVGVTRTNAPSAGKQFAGRLADQPGMPREAVLRAATINAAYTLRMEQDIGSLEPGKLADLIVLDRNFFRIPAEQIAQIKVLQTVVGGKVVYQHKAMR